jgi:hypothetical protein
MSREDKSALTHLLAFVAGYLLSGLVLFCYSPVTTEQPAPLTQEMRAEQRSACWRKTRAEALRRHPRCEACDRTKDLEAHHVLSFHAHPDRECDIENVIVLCHDCHFALGHLFDYKASNPNVREDAAYLLHRVRNRMYE